MQYCQQLMSQFSLIHLILSTPNEIYDIIILFLPIFYIMGMWRRSLAQWLGFFLTVSQTLHEKEGGIKGRKEGGRETGRQTGVFEYSGT